MSRGRADGSGKANPGALAGAAEGKIEIAKSRRKDSAPAKGRQQRWRQRNPRSYLAHLTVQNALRLGILVREPCEVCGAEKVEAHHPDYAAPLMSFGSAARTIGHATGTPDPRHALHPGRGAAASIHRSRPDTRAGHIPQHALAFDR